MVLTAFSNAFQNERNSKKDDMRVQMFPLLFMTRHPLKNKDNQRPTPLQVTLEKQSPQCFEMMLSLLNNQTGLCLTGHVLGKLKEIIESKSASVLMLFDECFRITDQISGPRPLMWSGDADELFVNVSTAFLETEDLQKLVNKEFNSANVDENEEEKDTFEKGTQVMKDGFIAYDVQVDEKILPDPKSITTSNVKQVEAKLLDMDWVFIDENAKTLIGILAETTND